MTTVIQQDFDKKYITSTEIANEVGVTKQAVMQARTSGKLPNAISIEHGHLYIWERVDVAPHIAAWKQRRADRGV